MNLRKIGIGLATLFVMFCVFFTAAFGFIVATNFENIGKAVNIISLIKIHSLKELSAAELLEGSMKGMIEALDDPYSAYLEPEVFKEITERIHGTYAGVGLLITIAEDDLLTVVSPFKGSPAHKAGILSGDIITAIDGRNTSDMDLETASNLMRGKPGTKVTLTVYRKNKGEKVYEITREVIEIPSVDGEIISENPDVGYISVSMFNENTGKELAEKVEELRLKGMKALILDLRNNPGGALQAAVEAADVFIDSGPIVHIKSKYNTEVYKAKKGKTDFPVVVLVNEGSASASEILAGAIQDTGAGILVGKKTFGKGVVQSLFKLEDGSAVKLTTAKYLTPDKRDIHKKGINPDVVVEMDHEETAQALLNAPDTEKDAQLKKALEILSKKLQ